MWLDEQGYADLVALCQFLPGPASSQVGFSVGLLRGGYLGGLAAWTGFTLPSAIALVLFAYGAAALGGPIGGGLLHGLKLVAVAIVAQAVWGMARSLCPDRERASIAAAAALIILLGPAARPARGDCARRPRRVVALCAGEPAPGGHLPVPVSRRVGVAALAVYVLLLAGLPSAQIGRAARRRLFNAFYRSGALCFRRRPCGAALVARGGGHSWMGRRQQFSRRLRRGAGGARAAFTFAAYLGAVMRPCRHGVAGRRLAVVAIFLPGLLVLVGALPFWESLRRRRGAQAAMRGVNAAVVGLLGAALYDPIWTSSVKPRRISGWRSSASCC